MNLKAKSSFSCLTLLCASLSKTEHGDRIKYFTLNIDASKEIKDIVVQFTIAKKNAKLFFTKFITKIYI